MINKEAETKARQVAKELEARNQRDSVNAIVASTPAWIRQVRDSLTLRIQAHMDAGMTLTAQNLQLVLDEIDPVIWILEAA